VAPHPDDELIGAPATLMALRDAGHRIVNLACSLGRPGDEARRAAELAEACRRAGFESRVLREPLEEDRLRARLVATLRAEPFGLVVGPSPEDRHPTHELVGRAVRAALESGAGPDRWWQWGLWGELRYPTVVAGFGEARLREILGALDAHTGEVARNDYRRLVEGRAMATAVLAAERVFGFGAPGLGDPYAEVVSELVRGVGGWVLGSPRRLGSGELLG
jgi:LmbE family N-acetylglucosaminyl deacetylase